MARLFQPLLFLLARSTEHELRRQIEFLKAENEVPRKRVPKQRIFLTKAERERLIKLGKAIGARCGQAHHHCPRPDLSALASASKCRDREEDGRPKTFESVREIIVRIAKETGWGIGRLARE